MKAEEAECVVPTKSLFDRTPLWTVDCNDHLGLDLEELPADFKPCGLLKQDFPKLCKRLGAIPHPAFRLRQSHPHDNSRRPSTAGRSSSAVSHRRSSRAHPGDHRGDHHLHLHRGGADSTAHRRPGFVLHEPDAATHAHVVAALAQPALNIRSVLLDRTTMQLVSLLLPRCTHIKHLCFSDCRLDAGALALLRRGLAGDSPVQALQVDWNPVEGPSDDPEEARAVVPEPASPSANAATEARGDPDADGAREEARDAVPMALAQFADGECTVESLSFRACNLGWRSIAPLCEAMGGCPRHLRSLNLWENAICDAGAEAIATALGAFRGLEFLGLGRNRITDAGLLSLCRPFQAQQVDEAGKAAALTRIKEQEGKLAAKAKAAAKASAKSAAKGPQPPPGREFRDASTFMDIPDQLEERPPVVDNGQPTYLLRRPSQLKLMIVSENPVAEAMTIEVIQPWGPKDVELVLKHTAAAAALCEKRPDFHNKEKRPFCPGGEGWVVRIV